MNFTSDSLKTVLGGNEEKTHIFNLPWRRLVSHLRLRKGFVIFLLLFVTPDVSVADCICELKQSLRQQMKHYSLKKTDLMLRIDGYAIIGSLNGA